ncbi:hypothetical protein I316_05581 [Kwoniella heveanensis BCC8398]|uniref:ferric-chelate reductase (NADPH) n=1 Tax=Kwoniella heveanensis BCC8398 TaxID=1296120 RepID=A0A1B9GNM8_9TREE|nr:hypothetical protein I316_05581 [Kwoniella heveanensis BCC8398]
MGLPAPVGYLYWYTTSIVLAILTVLNFSTKLYHHLTAPRKATLSSALTIAPATPRDEESSPPVTPNSVEKHDDTPQGHVARLGRLNRAFRSLGVMVEKHFYLSGITIHSRRFQLLGKTRKMRKRLYPTPDVLWQAGYTLGFLVLSFYGTGWDTLTWSNQAAWVAAAQVPMIIALAGKNNLISFLTGIPYDRLNYLHKASARLCLLGVWIHAGGHWKLTHGWNKEAWAKNISHWGFTGIFTITLLTVLSFPWFRRRMFEFFLVAHIALVALMLAAFVMHWRAMDVWIYPGAGLWAADRLIRVLRLVVLNKLWIRPSLSTTSIPSKATISLLTPSTILLTFNSPSPHLNWSAGHHFYVVMPGMSRFPWEAHPFTACTVPLKPGQGAESGELAFIIRVRDGFTKRMKERVDEARKERNLALEADCEVEVQAAVEGPYGVKSDLRGYEGILMFSGGSGISFAVANLLQTLREIREGKSRVKFISVVWMVKSRLHLDWISPLLLSHVDNLPPDLSLTIHVHVTRHTFPRLSLSHNTLPNVPNGDFEAYLAERAKNPNRHRRRSRLMSTFSWASWTGGSGWRVGGTRPGTRRGSIMPSESGKSDKSDGSDGSGSKKRKRTRTRTTSTGLESVSAASAAGSTKNQNRRRSSHAVSGSESEREDDRPRGPRREQRRPSIPAFSWTEGYADDTVFGGGNGGSVSGASVRKGSLMVPSTVPPVMESQELEIVLNQPTPLAGTEPTEVMPEQPPVNFDYGPDEVDPHHRPESPSEPATPPPAVLITRGSRGSIPWLRDSVSGPSGFPPHMVPPTPPRTPRTRQISISDEPPRKHSTPLSHMSTGPRRGSNRRGSVPFLAAASAAASASQPARPSILMPSPVVLRKGSRPSILDAGHLAAPDMSRSSSTTSGASMASFTTPSPPSPVQLQPPEDISRPLTPSMSFKQLQEATETSPEELRKSISMIAAIPDPQVRRESVAAIMGPVELELRKRSSEGLEGIVRWHEGRADIRDSIKEIMASVAAHTQLSSSTESSELEKLGGRRGGRVNVSCCGPTSLLDAVREGVKVEMDAEEVWKGGVMVDFHAETFGW